jgi:hypothetical protein
MAIWPLEPSKFCNLERVEPNNIPTLPSKMEEPTCPIPDKKVIQVSFLLDQLDDLPIITKGTQWSGARAWKKPMDKVESKRIRNEPFIFIPL